MATRRLPSLRTFLAQRARPKGTFSYHEMQGFLFAVVCSPDMVMPSEWLPVIFNEQPANYASEEEAQHILGGIMRFYNELNAEVLAGNPMLPLDCGPIPNVMANFEKRAPLAAWSRGFAQGHAWLEESWDVAPPEEMEQELDAALMVLTLFASRNVAEEYQREGDFGEGPLNEVAARIVGFIPDAMASYAHMGRTVLAEAYAAVEQRKVTKVGRNEPCPCGSGKK